MATDNFSQIVSLSNYHRYGEKYSCRYCKYITYGILRGNRWNKKESYSSPEVGRSELLPSEQGAAPETLVDAFHSRCRRRTAAQETLVDADQSCFLVHVVITFIHSFSWKLIELNTLICIYESIYIDFFI